jgi:tetratricopeptide (TPR) repeat protein
MLLLLVATATQAIDKKDYERYIGMIDDKKLDQIKPVIDSLEAHHQDDPETYVLIINYYLKKGMHEVLVVESGLPDSGMETMVLKDPKSGKDVGYMGSRMEIDTSFVIKGVDKLYNGTLKHPDRMDLWFGQATVSKMIGYVAGVERALTGVLKQSKKNNNRWTWGFENIEKGNTTKEFMLENLQAYTSYLFNVRNKDADSALVRISELLIKFYPDLIYGYNNIGIIKNMQGKYAEAQKYLDKALEIDPKDLLVLSNIGYNLSKMNKKKELQLLIERVEKIRGDDAKSLAEHLRTLL